MQTPDFFPPGLDPNLAIERLTPIIGLIAVILFGSLGIRWIFRTPVGEAIAHRIRERHGGPENPSERTAALEDRVSQLQDHVAELAERLDFAERLLAEKRDRKLGAGQ
jgi:hypothetical protein